MITFGSTESSAWLLAKEKLIMDVTVLVLGLCTQAPTGTGEAQTTTIFCQGSPPTSGPHPLHSPLTNPDLYLCCMSSFFFKLWYNTHIMFTILTIFKCILLYNDHHHQSIDLFSSCRTETLCRKSPSHN